MANNRIKANAQTLNIEEALPIGAKIEFPEFKQLNKQKPIMIEIQENGCYNCTSHAAHGFGYSSIYRNGKYQALHRYIFTMCKGTIPENFIVRHICDNPRCINPEHLILGQHEDNVRDRVERGRSAFGERNGRSKLTDEKVREIKSDTTSTITQLAKKYGVDPKAIRDIKQGKKWKHITATTSKCNAA